jgi:hypothetical protein
MAWTTPHTDEIRAILKEQGERLDCIPMVRLQDILDNIDKASGLTSAMERRDRRWCTALILTLTVGQVQDVLEKYHGLTE